MNLKKVVGIIIVLGTIYQLNLGDLFHTHTDSLLGTGVFNADGKFRHCSSSCLKRCMWQQQVTCGSTFLTVPTAFKYHDWAFVSPRFHRSMTRPFFSKERISHFDIFERHAADAIQQTKDRINAGFAIDFQASFTPPLFPTRILMEEAS